MSTEITPAPTDDEAVAIVAAVEALWPRPMVAADSENPLRLVFIERWRDQDSIWEHVSSPETRAFVKALGACVTEATPTEFFEAQTLPRPPRAR